MTTETKTEAALIAEYEAMKKARIDAAEQLDAACTAYDQADRSVRLAELALNGAMENLATDPAAGPMVKKVRAEVQRALDRKSEGEAAVRAFTKALDAAERAEKAAKAAAEGPAQARLAAERKAAVAKCREVLLKIEDEILEVDGEIRRLAPPAFHEPSYWSAWARFADGLHEVQWRCGATASPSGRS